MAQTRSSLRFFVKSTKISPFPPQKTPSSAHRRASVFGCTVSDTGFSVTLTEISLAQSAADECVFHPSSRPFASIWSAATLHVFGLKIHVVVTVCNKFCPVFRPSGTADSGVKMGAPGRCLHFLGETLRYIEIFPHFCERKLYVFL